MMNQRRARMGCGPSDQTCGTGFGGGGHGQSCCDAGKQASVLLKSAKPPSLSMLERDDFSSNRHPALSFCLSMIFSENRFPLFRIML